MGSGEKQANGLRRSAYWAEGATALKAGFDLFRSAVGSVREAAKALGRNDAKTKAAAAALDEALRSAQIAEAMMAKALGYKLCYCANPPTPMLTVGHGLGRGGSPSGPVFECPKCSYNTAAPWAYTRIAPEQSAKQ
jgi:hypothetical protein